MAILFFNMFEEEMMDMFREQDLLDLPCSAYKVVINLHTFYVANGRRPYRDEYGKNGLVDYDEMLLKCETYNRAMRLAGIKPAHPTDEDLITAVQHFATENGRPPTQAEAKAGLVLYGLNTYLRRFPNWTAVLLASGFHPPLRYTRDNPPSRRYLIVRLQRKARKIGRIPTRNDISSDPDMPANFHYDREFASLQNACKVARIRDLLQLPEESDETEKRAEMIAYLQRVADYLGYTPSMREMRLVAKPGFGPHVYCRMFNGWMKAIEAAGLETVRGFARYWKVVARRREHGSVAYEQVA